MQPITQLDTPERSVVMAAWAATLAESARQTLDHMSTTLTLAEAMVAMVRELIAQRRDHTAAE